MRQISEANASPSLIKFYNVRGWKSGMEILEMVWRELKWRTGSACFDLTDLGTCVLLEHFHDAYESGRSGVSYDEVFCLKHEDAVFFILKGVGFKSGRADGENVPRAEIRAVRMKDADVVLATPFGMMTSDLVRKKLDFFDRGLPAFFNETVSLLAVNAEGIIAGIESTGPFVDPQKNAFSYCVSAGCTGKAVTRRYIFDDLILPQILAKLK